MKKIAIYYRISTDHQDVEMQQGAITQWLAGYEKKYAYKEKIYQDLGFSGKINARPAYQQMLKDAFKGKIDLILVYSLDRMSRSAKEAIHVLLELEQMGVEFISVSQPVLNLGAENPFRRTLLAAFAEIAEIERETIAERVRAGLDSAKKKGVKLGPPVKVTETEAGEIRRLRELGYSYRKIVGETGYSYGTVYNLLQPTPDQG